MSRVPSRVGTDLPAARPHPEWSVSTPREQARGTSGEEDRGTALPQQGTALIQPTREEVGGGSPGLSSRWGGREQLYFPWVLSSAD